LKLHNLLEQGGITPVNDVSNVLQQIDVQGISDSSLSINEGFIFVAVKGFKTDGHTYIDQAIEQGAAVIIGEDPSVNVSAVPYIEVKNSRKALGQLSSAFYGFPCKDKIVIGITGTNGKTTTSLFLTHLLQKAGYSVSYFGTVFNEVNGRRFASDLTTPNANFIQRTLAESDDTVVVVEASSQGLDQDRMEGMAFDYALFTNLQKDHLDYHHTLDEYFSAKKRLFNLMKPDGKGIINVDDSWGNKLAEILKAEEKNILTLGSKEEDTFQIKNLEEKDSQFVVGGTKYTCQPPLPGKYNSLNLLMASLVIYDMGLPLEKIQQAILDVDPVPGRFERYKINGQVDIIVDYAHTTEAIHAVLGAINKLYSDRNLVHLFGFRGNRDTTKRRLMVEASTKYSTHTVLTMDDLNTSTYNEMEEEYKKYESKQVSIEMDRTLALKNVVDRASEPTVVVLTGKGHEDYTTETFLGTGSDKETAVWLQNNL